MQSEQLLCWNGMTDAEHSTTSSSNEDEDLILTIALNSFGTKYTLHLSISAITLLT